MYRWDFGDGATGHGAIQRHRYEVPGSYDVRLSFTDHRGLTSVKIERIQAKKPSFLRGDCNADGGVNVADASCALNWLFGGEGAPGCIAALNTNGDEGVDIADAVALLNHLFAGGPAPVPPFPDCGPGELVADEKLGCENSLPDCAVEP